MRISDWSSDVCSSDLATRWGRPLSGFEAGIWLMMMWIFGAIITLGLLSFNLPRVRVAGDPTLPYLLAGVGYPGLLLVTLLFVRSEERSVGKACVSTCRPRWSPYH